MFCLGDKEGYEIGISIIIKGYSKYLLGFSEIYLIFVVCDVIVLIVNKV